MITPNFRSAEYIAHTWTPHAVSVHFDPQLHEQVADITSASKESWGIPKFAAEASATGRLLIAGGLAHFGVEPLAAMRAAGEQDIYHSHGESEDLVIDATGSVGELIGCEATDNYRDIRDRAQKLELLNLGLAIVALADGIERFVGQSELRILPSESAVGVSRMYYATHRTARRGQRGRLVSVGMALHTYEHTHSATPETLQAVDIIEQYKSGKQLIYRNALGMHTIKSGGGQVIEYVGESSEVNTIGGMVIHEHNGKFGLSGVAHRSTDILIQD